MLNREIPFLRIIIPLCLGIIAGVYFVPGNLFFAVAGIIIVILFSLSLLFNRRLTNQFFGVVLASALFYTGLLLYTLEKQRLSVLKNEETVICGYLKDYPEEKENSWGMILKMEKRMMSGGEEKLNGSILLYYTKDGSIPALSPGDRLALACTPQEILNRGNPYEFDYRFYMENNGIKYYAFIDSTDILFHSVPGRRKPAHRALIVREKIIGMFRERGLEGSTLALVAAITLGQKTMLDQEQKQNFIEAGVMHIMAVSGLHAMILSMFIFRILFFLKGRLNIIRVIVTIVTLWGFAFITGLTPSVMRAAIMYTFLQAGKIMKRPVNGINSVLASAFVLIIAHPPVIFAAGFQLSYSAVIYIILFYRKLYLKLRFRRRLPDLVWQSAAVTITAQAGTLPLTVMLFNRFPTWFILSNIIIVPLSSLVVILGFMFPAVYPLVFFSEIIAKVLGFLTTLTERLTEITSSLPLSTIENIGMTAGESALLAVLIFLMTKYLLDRKSISVLYPLASLLIFTGTLTIKETAAGRTAEMIVFNTINSSVTGIRSGSHLTIWADSATDGREAARQAAVLNLKVHINRPEEDIFCLEASGKKILVTNTISAQILNSAMPDIVILTGSRPYVQNDLQYGKRLEAVVVSPEVSSLYRIQRQLEAMETANVHFVREEGAFRLRLQ